MWLAAERDPGAGRRAGRARGRRVLLENLNTAVDHPGTPFARAADTLALVEAVDSPHLRMNLDLYHAQIGEGNLIELVRDGAAWIGEIQVADVPGRCEPGTGEINYPAIARALVRAGYNGVVGLEAWAAATATPPSRPSGWRSRSDRGCPICLWEYNHCMTTTNQAA